MRSRPVPAVVLASAALTILSVLAASGGTVAARGRSAPPGDPLRADPKTITLSPLKDNTLYESVAGNVSNGQGSHFFAGNSNAALIHRAVIAFDIAGSIPAGAEVDSVTLSLNMSRTSSGAQQVRLYRLTRSWGEGPSNADANEGSGDAAEAGDATWLHGHYPDQAWSSAGGDYVTAASASTSVSAVGRYTWSSNDMADEVEAWLADPSTNHGWILIGQERGSDGAKLSRTSKRFDSRDNAAVTSRPQLIVEYRVEDSTSTPETSTPETSTPGTSTPETSTPETQTPGTSTPETSTPETSTPETSTPETSTPETSTPGTSTPRTDTPPPPTAESPTPVTATTPVPRSTVYLPIASRGP